MKLMIWKKIKSEHCYSQNAIAAIVVMKDSLLEIRMIMKSTDLKFHANAVYAYVGLSAAHYVILKLVAVEVELRFLKLSKCLIKTINNMIMPSSDSLRQVISVVVASVQLNVQN